MAQGRGVAQPGSAPALGAGGRWFESSRPDQFSISRSQIGHKTASDARSGARPVRFGTVNHVNGPPLVWSSALTLPTDGRPLVYLDLNHWISLAKVAVGHRQGLPLVETLEACRAAVRMAAATFVL